MMVSGVESETVMPVHFVFEKADYQNREQGPLWTMEPLSSHHRFMVDYFYILAVAFSCGLDVKLE